MWSTCSPFRAGTHFWQEWQKAQDGFNNLSPSLKSTNGLSMKRVATVLSANINESKELELTVINKAGHCTCPVTRAMIYKLFSLDESSPFYWNSEVAGLAEQFRLNENKTAEEWQHLKDADSASDIKGLSELRALFRFFAKTNKFTWECFQRKRSCVLLQLCW